MNVPSLSKYSSVLTTEAGSAARLSNCEHIGSVPNWASLDYHCSVVRCMHVELQHSLRLRVCVCVSSYCHGLTSLATLVAGSVIMPRPHHSPSPSSLPPCSPSDFHVTELSPQGCPASAEDQTLPPPPPPVPLTVGAPKRRKVVAVAMDSGGEEGGGQGVWSGGAALCTPWQEASSDMYRLEDLVGAELASEVAKLSHDYQLTKTPSDERVALGGFRFHTLCVHVCGGGCITVDLSVST